MSKVQRDIYSKNYEWHYTTLSDEKSIKALLKYRNKYDLLYTLDKNTYSLYNSYVYLNNMSEEIMCLYIYLDTLIKDINLNNKQNTILKFYMMGYTEKDLSQYFKVTQPVIQRFIISVCKRILSKAYNNWLPEFIYWNKKRVLTEYKKCVKCEKYFQNIEKCFGKKNDNKDRLENRCKNCESLRKK